MLGLKNFLLSPHFLLSGFVKRVCCASASSSFNHVFANIILYRVRRCVPIVTVHSLTLFANVSFNHPAKLIFLLRPFRSVHHNVRFYSVFTLLRVVWLHYVSFFCKFTFRSKRGAFFKNPWCRLGACSVTLFTHSVHNCVMYTPSRNNELLRRRKSSPLALCRLYGIVIILFIARRRNLNEFQWLIPPPPHSHRASSLVQLNDKRIEPELILKGTHVVTYKHTHVLDNTAVTSAHNNKNQLLYYTHLWFSGERF